MIASDGLFEMPTGPRKVLGVRRVRAMLAASDQASLAEARDGLVAEVEALATDTRADDMTFVLVGR